MERGGLQTYLRPQTLGVPGRPGHDAIRTHGSQSMIAALEATVVTGLSVRRSDLFTRQLDLVVQPKRRAVVLLASSLEIPQATLFCAGVLR